MKFKTIALLSSTALAFGLIGCEADPGPVQPPSYAVPTQAQVAAYSVPDATPPVPIQLADNLLADNYLILLDTSGSMNDPECSDGDRKITVATRAIQSFVQTLPSDSNVGFMVFNSRLVTPFGSGNAHKQNLVRSLPSKGGGRTPLVSSTSAAEKLLSNQAERQLWYGTYKLIIVTDGSSTDGDPGPLAKEIVEKKPLEIHAIGFCQDAGHSLNVPGYTTYYSAMDPESLNAALASVRAEVEAFDAATTFE